MKEKIFLIARLLVRLDESLKKLDLKDRLDMLVHTVVFWLKNDLSDRNKSTFFKEVATLGTISSVEDFHLGTPAETPKRPVIDDSYDCVLTVVLKDLAAHDQYQVDPIHRTFIAACSSFWERVVIYDAD